MKNVIIKGTECSVLRLEASHGGGGIEIELDNVGWPDVKMTAYQNYLGGGMLGRVCSDCTISDFRDNEDLLAISEELKSIFHGFTNHDDDEWETATYEENQNRSVSAY